MVPTSHLGNEKDYFPISLDARCDKCELQQL